jgi:ComF family protein
MLLKSETMVCVQIAKMNCPGRHPEIVDINRAITNFVCHRCEAAPPTFDRCTTLFAYEGPVPDMIKRFKDRASFSDYRCLSRLLCHQFHHYYANEPVATPDFLIPVPMHNSRIRWRGFNQSVMLTRFLSRHTGVPTLLQGCQRLPTLRAQRGLNARQRLGNMPQMFTPGPHASRLSGCNLAIIDDVVTTTATAQAMAGVLKDCGASSIHVWALARVNL